MADYWPTAANDPEATPAMREFGPIWTDKPKIVFSNTLETTDWNSRVVDGDVGDVLKGLRNEFDGDLDVGGATLASEFIERGLIDEFRLVIHPVLLGGGMPMFPHLRTTQSLRLVETRTFESGVVLLRYERV
jgi:dihydrofolate reductase